MKEIKKAKMSQIVGGTTTTEMVEVGVIVENEYPEVRWEKESRLLLHFLNQVIV